MVTSSSDYGSVNRAAYGGQNVRTTFSYPMFQQFVADNRTMDDLFACVPHGRVNVVVDGQAELADGLHLDRQLLLSPRRQRPARPRHCARRRSPDRAAGRGDQLQVLALALRHRSRASSARR